MSRPGYKATAHLSASSGLFPWWSPLPPLSLHLSDYMYLQNCVRQKDTKSCGLYVIVFTAALLWKTPAPLSIDPQAVRHQFHSILTDSLNSLTSGTTMASVGMMGRREQQSPRAVDRTPAPGVVLESYEQALDDARATELEWAKRVEGSETRLVVTRKKISGSKSNWSEALRDVAIASNTPQQKGYELAKSEMIL